MSDTLISFQLKYRSADKQKESYFVETIIK